MRVRATEPPLRFFQGPHKLQLYDRMKHTGDLRFDVIVGESQPHPQSCPSRHKHDPATKVAERFSRKALWLSGIHLPLPHTSLSAHMPDQASSANRQSSDPSRVFFAA